MLVCSQSQSQIHLTYAWTSDTVGDPAWKQQKTDIILDISEKIAASNMGKHAWVLLMPILFLPDVSMRRYGHRGCRVLRHPTASSCMQIAGWIGGPRWES